MQNLSRESKQLQGWHCSGACSNAMSLIKVQSRVVNNFRQKENINIFLLKERYVIHHCWKLLKL